MKLSAGGCPWGRAREQKYGVKPNEPLPDEARRDAGEARREAGEDADGTADDHPQM